MVVNPKKFQVMSIYKKKNAILIDLNLQMNNTEITPKSSVELPGVTIGNELKLITILVSFEYQQDASLVLFSD